jgi:type II secretory pathway pseudopilin PulG
MATHPCIKLRCRKGSGSRGFALISTLLLMILLTVIAVGLLSLSSISLRQSSASLAMADAMADARLSLMLALGQLQTELGPDTRVSVAADQLPKSATDGTGSAADASRRQWIGVYDAWPAPADASAADPRPTPVFRQWLVSGNPVDLANPDFSKSSTGTTRELVGKGTMGAAATAGLVSVPMMEMKSGTVTKSRIAWWVGDQGAKAAISTPQPEAPGNDRALVRAGLQGAPRNAVQLAESNGVVPFAAVDFTAAADLANLAKITDWQQAGLLASSPRAPAPLFHDLVSDSSGLLTNVRSGGFRKDLSMYLETSAPPAAPFPAPLDGAKGALYRVDGQDGIRIGELWSYYNLYKELNKEAAGATNNPQLQSKGTLAEARLDPFFYFKRPVVISYKALFSFYITDGNPRKLAVCVDPVVTFWNPCDVPLSLGAAWNSIRFHKIPYTIDNLKVDVESGGMTTNVGTFNINLGGAKQSKSSFAVDDYNYGTLICGKAPDKMVLKPGEVMVYSQGPNTLPASGNTAVVSVAGKPGYNFGGGIYFVLKDQGTGAQITLPSAPISRVTLSFEGITANKEIIRQGVGGWNPADPPISTSHFETYLFDASASGGGIGGVYVDFWRGIPPHTSPKPDTQRFTANQKPAVFKKLPGRTSLEVAASGAAIGRKTYFMLYACDAKTEEDSQRPGQFLSRFNPSASLVDFADLSDAEMDLVPFELNIQAISGKDAKFDVATTGQGFFGGGLISGNGSSYLTTHSVPREPIVSLGALQHSMANGFNRDMPDMAAPSYSAGPTNQSIRLPMLPQISHAIGNSLAPAVLAKDKTQGALAGRPLADHSYLANKALWDDWFFSGIAPRDKGPNATGLSQKDLAAGFLSGTAKLPAARYQPNLGHATSEDVLNRLFAATAPKAEATALAASFLRVEGMFNVNSTSVEAWKAMLGSLRKHPVSTRDAAGVEAINATSDTPVSSLLAPTGDHANDPNMDVKDVDQWTGRRTLSDAEITTLAGKLVEEVRKRGPFLSLADFINRRVGNDETLARAGALQSAIDAAKINKGYDARLSAASPTLAFPAAENQSPAAQGAPGIVKQADLLTPIAPVLSARSDSFIIRGYGEKLDASGTKVLARAWCEAVVERDCGFVDSSDPPETALATLNPVNRKFGRRFIIRSFRWLNPGEV